ncbi:MAG: PQQ-binding-like beta-propeller repeat protein, partial [Candidatus Krumholzibacteria bacterium]|nr:PQQ-binding-like beta-propeller repeat protein [Candidatus Krumholzibacteria bacterium]
FHQRCYRSRATDNYILPSRNGIEFVDFRSENWTIHHWIRGGCLFGIVPANGMIYTPPNTCACYYEAKTFGFTTVAPALADPDYPQAPSDSERLKENLPIYNESVDATPTGEEDWPTYRHDGDRSGKSPTVVPADLLDSWQTDLGGKLSTLTVANGRIYVAQVDKHIVHALSEADGTPLWSFRADGRVDSPPTIYKGRVIFGSADGHVYCLRATDGALIWRFQGAPEDLSMPTWEQLESVWPIHGSVLVQNDGTEDAVYCVAGRNMFLDGGLRFLKLDAVTGTKLTERTFDDKIPGTDESLQSKMESLDMPVALADILSSDGKRLYMRSQNFDLNGHRSEIPVSGPTDQGGDQAHLVCPSGFLDSNWHHRSYWVFGNGYGTGHNGWFRAGRYAPAGRILVFDKNTVYGYGRQPEYYVWSTALEYQLFAAQRDMKPESIAFTLAANNKQESAQEHGHEITFDRELMRQYPLKEISAMDFNWRKENPPLMARAMVLAGKTLFVAGPADVLDEEELFAKPFDPKVIAKSEEQKAALKGEHGAILQAVSAKTGQKLSELQLDALPAFDGMAAAEGRLFISMTDGTIRCFGKKI